MSMQLNPSEWPCEQSYWAEHFCAVNYCPAVARIWVFEFIPKEWRVSLVWYFTVLLSLWVNPKSLVIRRFPDMIKYSSLHCL